MSAAGDEKTLTAAFVSIALGNAGADASAAVIDHDHEKRTSAVAAAGASAAGTEKGARAGENAAAAAAAAALAMQNAVMMTPSSPGLPERKRDIKKTFLDLYGATAVADYLARAIESVSKRVAEDPGVADDYQRVSAAVTFFGIHEGTQLSRLTVAEVAGTFLTAPPPYVREVMNKLAVATLGGNHDRFMDLMKLIMIPFIPTGQGACPFIVDWVDADVYSERFEVSTEELFFERVFELALFDTAPFVDEFFFAKLVEQKLADQKV